METQAEITAEIKRINNMTRQDAINNLKAEIDVIQSGPDVVDFFGHEINPKDALPAIIAGLENLENMTDEHFDKSRQFND